MKMSADTQTTTSEEKKLRDITLVCGDENKIMAHQLILTNSSVNSMTSLTNLDCTECGLMFRTEKDLKMHNQRKHGVRLIGIEEELVSSVVKIDPDLDFLTKNTADLKVMLEAIPKNKLLYDEDAFEKDFKLILNSVEKDVQTEAMISFKCEKCNFRGSSKR